MSVIIPTYEQEDLAEQAVHSALAQNYPYLEVVVVDDASPCATYGAIRAVGDPRLRYIRRAQNVGRTENYRHSLRDIARGDWAMILDGDDYLTDPDFISRAMEAAGDEPDIVMVAGRSELRTGDLAIVSDHPGDRLEAGLDVLRKLPDQRYFLQHLAVLYRRQEAVALDFYRSPAISSDWESLYRLACHGKLRFLDRVAGVWRIHGSNASSSLDRQAMIDNLGIWSSIYTEATAQGMPVAEAARHRAAVMRYLMRQHIPRVARSWRGLVTYLQQLRQQHPSALAGLAHGPTLARLALALSRYYG